jgi:predicted nuclease of predicted toxin-antitoxin system
VKLLLDEMLSGRIAAQLRQHDRDTLAVEESANLRGVSDPDLFAHAQEMERAIVTYNREDFLALGREYQSRERPHHGIVFLHPRRFPQGNTSTDKLVVALSSFIGAREPYPNFIHWLQ